MTKIDKTGIISKKIVTDNLYNTQGDKYLTASDLGGASGNFQEIIDNAVQQATEDANEAKVLAETAAVNALESERNVTVRAEEIISQVTSEAKEAKVLAETAAVNALEAERNVTDLSENLSERIGEILSADGEIRITSAHALGDFYFSITSHMPEGVLPLNGTEVSRVTYSDLYDYVLNIHNELVASDKKFIISEEEWQNISIENNGYVPYYSYGTTDGMFRLPRMSGYLKATGEVDEAGNYVAEGLPNITGTFTHGGINAHYSGAFKNYSEFGGVGQNAQKNFIASFDASLSNPIYGNSEHVTPETNTLFVGVWALTAFTQVGTANLAEIKEILSQCEIILGDSLPLLSSRYDNRGLETSAWKLSDGSWLDGRIYTDAYNKILQRIAEGDTVCLEMKESELLSSNEFPENFLIDTESVKFRLPLFVVNERTIIKEYKNGTSWYTLYSDGWCEQGALATTSSVTFSIPFKDSEYSLTTANVGTNSTSTYEHGAISSRTTTGFTWAVYDSFKLMYRAAGYAADLLPREEWEIDFNYYFKVSHGVDDGRINIEEKLTEFEETAYTRLDEIVEEVSKDYVVHVDKTVGELYFSFNDYFPDGVIPLDGRLVSRATYADLWEWVQEKGLVKDDALITNNDENTVSIFNEDGTIRYCQWYGSGDGSLTFRMPKINGYLGATGDNTLAGQYIAEGLPNILGTIADVNPDYGTVACSQAFYKIDGSHWCSRGGGGGDPKAVTIKFDASRYDSIYGNSEHVTPETNILFVGVWAITAAKAAVFDMRDVEEALKSAESYLMNNVPLMSSRWDKDGLGNLGWVKADGSWVDGRTYTGAYNYCVDKLISGHEDFIDGQLSAINEENFDKFIVDRISKRFRLPITNGQRTWEEVQGLNNSTWVLYWKLAHEFYAPAQAELQDKLDLIDNLVAKTDINLPTLSSRWDSVYAENVGWVKSEGQWLNGNTYHDAYELMVSRIGINDKFIEATVGTELTYENADKFLIDTTAVKFRLPLINGERTLVSTYKDETTWYNWYSDGWAEQGKKYVRSAGETSTIFNVTFTLLVPMKDNTYTVNTIASGMAGDKYGEFGLNVETITSTSFKIHFYTGSNADGINTIYSNVKGYAALPTVNDYNCNNYLFFKLADEVPTTVVNTEQVIADMHQECLEYKADMDAILALGSDYICGCMIPDYTTGLDLTSGVETVMPYHAWIYCLAANSGSTGWAQTLLDVNGVRIGIANVTNNTNDTCVAFAKKGDIVKVQNQGESGSRLYVNKYYRLSGASAE